MTHRAILTVTLVAVLALGLFVPAAAAAPGDAGVDECKNAENGPGDGGPPSFVGDLLPEFLGDLMSGLPVPNFVKTLFGASTC
ncbi:MAG: histidine kinase [Halolamina sp.]